MSYVVVSLLSTVSAEAVEPVFDSLFALFGAPLVLKTDNGPPFQSKSFSDFATRQGFHHRKVTPEWPRANGEVEHFMRNLSKVARTAKINGTNREVELRSFLRAYRDTPHSTIGVAPALLLLGYSRTSGLPSSVPSREQLDQLHQGQRRKGQRGYETRIRRTRRVMASVSATSSTS